MNILFVTPDYPKRGQPTTGFPNYLYRVSLSLIQMGHKPMILAGGAWDDHRVERGIEIWTVRMRLDTVYTELKSPTIKYALKALEISYSINHKIKELLGRNHIDIIQFTSLYGTALFYGQRMPVVLRLSSYAKTAYASYQTYSRTAVAVMSFIERLSSARCNAVFAPCKTNALVFGKDCKRNVKVIETPFVNDVQEYDNSYVDTYLKGKKYVLYFGSFYVEKGVLVIAEILEKFLKENPDYYFVFIGDAWQINGQSAAALLRKKAGACIDRVIINKALPHKQLYPVIKYSQFVVLPSLMENLSNACIEAMYFEKLVIGTDKASFEQLITHGRNGLLCRINDSQDLLQKMQRVISMEAFEKKQMEKRAKQRIDRLRPEYAVKRLLKLYEYVIDHYCDK